MDAARTSQGVEALLIRCSVATGRAAVEMVSTNPWWDIGRAEGERK
jgi:hypothetical protein